MGFGGLHSKMITIGTSPADLQIQIPLDSLANHVAVFGTSGAGKTGCIINIMEQALSHEVPVFAIDIKGDLANILQQPDPECSFIPRLLTPGAKHGDPVNLFSRLTHPAYTDSTVTSLLRLMGVDSSKTAESSHLYLTSLVKYHAANNPGMQLEDLLPLLITPGLTHIGMLPVDEVIPKAQRKLLALKLNTVIASPSFDLWRTGVALDFDELMLGPSIVIYSVAHIVDEAEQGLAIAYALTEYLAWTKAQQGTTELRSLLVLDECSGIMPPYPKNPPTKTPLLTLLRQARAYGVGVVIGTQNPKEVDYKGMGQCQTWVIGQLKNKHDRSRVLEGIVNASVSNKEIDERITNLQKRQFLVSSQGKLAVVRSADVKAKLSGPMSPSDFEALMAAGRLFRVSNLLAVRNHLVHISIDRTIREDEAVTPKQNLMEKVWNNLWS